MAQEQKNPQGLSQSNRQLLIGAITGEMGLEDGSHIQSAKKGKYNFLRGL